MSYSPANSETEKQSSVVPVTRTDNALLHKLVFIRDA